MRRMKEQVDVTRGRRHCGSSVGGSSIELGYRVNSHLSNVQQSDFSLTALDIFLLIIIMSGSCA